jgi:hypothetical protein
LRIAINSSPTFAGPKVTNKLINDVLGIDHTPSNRVGKYAGEQHSSGLSTEQIAQVVDYLGMHVHVADFLSDPAIDYEDYIYPLIESGCPTILGIVRPKVAHVVAVLGHTLNSDRWTPEARVGYGGFPISPYVSTSAWADHFIVGDDNFGMYVTIPTDSIRNVLVPKHNPNLHAAHAIGIVPRDVAVPGYFVEQASASVANTLIQGATLGPANRWFQVLKEHPLVCRTLLSEKANYTAVMAGVSDERGNKLTDAEKVILNASLPPRFWLTEITVPNLYTGNKRKLGDIITRADATPGQFNTREAIVFAWLPGLVMHGPALAGGSINGSLLGHTPLLRGASQDRPALEW